jgi:hypothetical protein
VGKKVGDHEAVVLSRGRMNQSSGDESGLFKNNEMRKEELTDLMSG